MNGVHRKTVSALILAALVLMIAGCGGSDDSPEAVFATAKKAAENKDYEKFAQCLTPESQETLAGGLVFAGTMIKAFAGLGEQDENQKKALAEIDEILKKHGLDPEKLDEGPPEEATSPEEAIAALGKKIDDKAAFIGDMMKAMESLDESEGAPAVAGELVDLKITDDKATATVVHKEDGKEQREPIEFRKLSDGWRIHLPMEQMQGGPPAKPEFDMGPGEFDLPGPETEDPAPPEDEG
jgi:hypothetical protein